MSNREEILEYLTRNPGSYCDECISKMTGIHPHQQVNSICRKLAEKGTTQRRQGICATCHKNNIINLPSSAVGMTSPRPEIVTPHKKTDGLIQGIPNNTPPLSPQQFEDRVNQFVTRYFHKQFSEQALDLGQGKMHKFDLVSADHSIIIECKSYTWTSGGNYPSGKISTLKEALLYFRTIQAQKKILVMHHKEFLKKELLADVFFRQNRQLFGDLDLWDYIVSIDPIQDKVRIVTSGNTIIGLNNEGAA